MWKDSSKFLLGEFVETVSLGAAIFPTLANVNHACDPNILLVNWRQKAIALANRPIRKGEQIFDTYGAVAAYMPGEDRRAFLKVRFSQGG